VLVQQTLQAAADPMYPFSHALDLSRVADLALVRSIVGHLAAGILKVTLSVDVPDGRASDTSKKGYQVKQCQACISQNPASGSRPVPPCKVTNTGEEMRDPELWGKYDPDIIELDQLQIPQPELGPLERRVDLTYEDALFSEDIDPVDTEYWFTEPPGMCSFHAYISHLACKFAPVHLLIDSALCASGGWNQEKKKLRKATVIPNADASAEHFGEGRVSHLCTFSDNSMLQPRSSRQSRCTVCRVPELSDSADHLMVLCSWQVLTCRKGKS